METTLKLRTSFCTGVAAVLFALAGCKGFKAKPADQYVFVTAKTADLRDRVAAVSNKTGSVTNGDKLKVLEHGRHFLRVQTDKGETGWIKETAVATGDSETGFDKLKADHKADPTVASGVVRDQVYMHLKPGRDTEKFYLLNEGEKLQLLERATLIKNQNPALVARAQKAIPQAAGSDAKLKNAPPKPVTAAAPLPSAMEDWWLVRDSQGHTGWLYSHMMDVDAPDALTRYAEGQRFVGAYVLTTVHDNDAPGDVKDIPVYVTVLSPYKAGLPYDFDQVRVFTWSLSHHRYETGFREKNIEGYLPVTIGKMKDPGGKTPAAQAGPAQLHLQGASPRTPPPRSPTPKPEPWCPPAPSPGPTAWKATSCTASLAPGAQPEAVAHPAPEEKKDKKGKK